MLSVATSFIAHVEFTVPTVRDWSIGFTYPVNNPANDEGYFMQTFITQDARGLFAGNGIGTSQDLSTIKTTTDPIKSGIISSRNQEINMLLAIVDRWSINLFLNGGFVHEARTYRPYSMRELGNVQICVGHVRGENAAYSIPYKRFIADILP